MAAEIRDKRLATVPLAGETPFLDVNIAYLRDQHLSHPARAFVEMLKKMANEGPEERGIRKIMADYIADWQGMKPESTSR